MDYREEKQSGVIEMMTGNSVKTLYDEKYYNAVWNRVLKKYTVVSPVYDLGDLSRQQMLYDFVKSCFQPKPGKKVIRIADFGAGNWLYLGTLLKAVDEWRSEYGEPVKVEIDGVDFSLQALHFGINKYKGGLPEYVTIHTHAGNLLEIAKQFEPSSFDLIISLETMEHLYNDRFFVRAVHDLLNKNGIFIASVPNKKPFFGSKNWFTYVFFRQKFSQKDRLVGHLRRYSRENLYKLAEGFYLKVIRSKCYGFLLSDYLKDYLKYAEKKAYFPKAFKTCMKVLMKENIICNRFGIFRSEGIFVCMRKGRI